MKQIGVSFQGWEVCAILEERKTQARRPIKPTPSPGTNLVEWNTAECAFVPWAWTNGPTNAGGHRLGAPFACPYGVPGDRLYARETHTFDEDGRVIYAADYDDARAIPTGDGIVKPRWTPAIHMRRADSRFDLEVTAVRAERLQSISEEDARAEGCQIFRGAFGQMVPGPPRQYAHSFEILWDKINGERAPWASNPWVWVVEFRVVRGGQ